MNNSGILVTFPYVNFDSLVTKVIENDNLKKKRKKIKIRFRFI